MKQKIKIYLIAVIIVTLFSTCKKYPENALWFKNPEKLYPFQGYITKYEVDGIDSLDLLSKYYGNAYGLDKNFRNAKFATTENFKVIYCRVVHGNSGLSSRIDYEFIKKKKYLHISLSTYDTTIYKKNIFISSEVEWQIVRLAKSGAFKLKTKYNGKNYEIQFN
jgi:hypothetical protein